MDREFRTFCQVLNFHLKLLIEFINKFKELKFEDNDIRNKLIEMNLYTIMNSLNNAIQFQCSKKYYAYGGLTQTPNIPTDHVNIYGVALIHYIDKLMKNQKIEDSQPYNIWINFKSDATGYIDLDNGIKILFESIQLIDKFHKELDHLYSKFEKLKANRLDEKMWDNNTFKKPILDKFKIKPEFELLLTIYELNNRKPDIILTDKYINIIKDVIYSSNRESELCAKMYYKKNNNVVI